MAKGRRQRIRTDNDRERDRRRIANFTEEQRERQVSRKYKATHPLRILLCDAKRPAQRKGVEFNLLESDFDLPLPTRCPILGIPLQYAGNGKGRQDDNSATMDKINNDQGYVRGNAIIVSWKANRMKSNATTDELLALGRFYKARKLDQFPALLHDNNSCTTDQIIRTMSLDRIY